MGVCLGIVLVRINGTCRTFNEELVGFYGRGQKCDSGVLSHSLYYGNLKF